jgi:hypothetical protein
MCAGTIRTGETLGVCQVLIEPPLLFPKPLEFMVREPPRALQGVESCEESGGLSCPRISAGNYEAEK